MKSSILNKFNFLKRYHQLGARERFLLIGTLIVVLLLIADFAIVKPLWNYNIKLGEQTAVLEKKLIRNLLNINRKERVEKEFEKHRHWIHPPSTDEEEIGKMLSEVEQEARNNQVTLVDMKPRETKSKNFYKEYRAELDAEMPMDNWVRFVYEVENLDQLVLLTITKLTYRGDDNPVIKAKMAFTKTLFLEKK